MDRFHSRDHKLKGSISNDIKENITYVKQVMKDCNDLVEKQFQIGPKHEISLYIVYMDGLVDTEMLQESVIRPLLLNDEETEDRDWIRHCFVYHLMCSDQRIRWKNA